MLNIAIALFSTDRGCSSAPVEALAQMGIFSSREEPSQQQSSQQVAGQASSSPSNEAWQNSQATWVPDQASPNCQLCEAPFGMWLWRHHCRQSVFGVNVRACK
jgi:hypothetical protein